MKFWLVILTSSTVWVALDLGIYYFTTGPHTAATDEALGRVAGIGFGAIWGVAIVWRFAQKQRGRQSQVTKQYDDKAPL